MKTILFQLTAEQIATIVGESQTFKSLVIAKLFDALENDTTLKRNGLYANDAINRLSWYIQDNYDKVNSKIAAIKYVRQWSVDFRGSLTECEFNDLNSLRGAKEFVEKALGVGIYK